MKGICVVGAAKTGTTGLYESIRAGWSAAGGDFYGMHEKYDPATFRALELYAPDQPVLAKMLVTNVNFSTEVVQHFERVVATVRDPRDTLLSATLYLPQRAVNQGVDASAIDEFVAMVRRKERDPAAHAFYELLVAAHSLIGAVRGSARGFTRRFGLTNEFFDEVSALPVRYEEFVRDELSELSDTLGFDVHNEKPSDVKKLVFRSGGSGEWRRWFVESDIDEFRPLLKPYMDRFGYDDDWELEDEPIDASGGSQYIERTTRERREQIELNEARDDVSDERLDLLRARADDGADSAAYRLTRLLRKLGEDEHADEIFRRAQFAARCGSPPAMQVLADLYDDGVGVRADALQARFWRREADIVAVRSGQSTQPTTKQRRRRKAAPATTIETLQDEVVAARTAEATARRELDRVRESTRYRLGSELADGVRSPRALLRLPARLYRLARDGASTGLTRGRGSTDH